MRCRQPVVPARADQGNAVRLFRQAIPRLMRRSPNRTSLLPALEKSANLTPKENDPVPPEILPHPAAVVWFRPVAVRHAPLFVFVLLTAACALASFAFACATPFAAFAVIAAASLSLPAALVVVGGAWIVNQAIGFGALHYPLDVSTMLWGAVIGAAAFAATFSAAIILRRLSRPGTPIVLGAALLAAYAAYELVLFAATPFLGGAGAFTIKIVGRLGMISVFWLIVLVAACETFPLLGSGLGRQAAS
jgi:hypothetical protein